MPDETKYDDGWYSCPDCGKHIAKWHADAKTWEVKHKRRRGYVHAGLEFCSRCGAKCPIPPTPSQRRAATKNKRPVEAQVVSRPTEAPGGKDENIQPQPADG